MDEACVLVDANVDFLPVDVAFRAAVAELLAVHEPSPYVHS